MAKVQLSRPRKPLGIALGRPRLGTLAASRSYLPACGGPQQGSVCRHGHHIEPGFGVSSRRLSRRGLYARRDAVAVASLPYPSYGLYVGVFPYVEAGR